MAHELAAAVELGMARVLEMQLLVDHHAAGLEPVVALGEEPAEVEEMDDHLVGVDRSTCRGRCQLPVAEHDLASVPRRAIRSSA